MTGFVYVISSAAGLYKIGFTSNPRKRLSMLRTSTHDKLTLVGVVPATMKHEKELHRLLAPSRVAREWFCHSKAMQPLLDGLTPMRRSTMSGYPGADLAHPLLTYRVVNDLSQQEIADKLGVTRVVLSRWETGARKIPATRCIQIEATLGIRCSDLRPDVFLRQQLGEAA